METTVTTPTEYREVSLALLTESKTNPRRVFEVNALKELAQTVRAKGVLSPLLVRPLNERSFEIVFGARRFRAAKLAEAATVPVRIKNMSDAEVLGAQLIENLQRSDVHPMEEAEGFKRLLDLEEPKYSIEQIAAKTGKNPSYITQRLKLTELSGTVVEAFYAEEIGVGHALLLAKLPADKQVEALTACFQEEWSASRDRKAKRILLPVRHLQSWIEQNILLLLKDAPFDKRDAHLVAIAGSCVDCPNRTGHNKLLFAELGKQDACTNPSCYQAKVEAHIAKAVAEKPKLVQISTAYTKPPEGSTALPRGKYIAIREDKPKDKDMAQQPQFKTCRYVTDAIVADGEGKGEIHKVCAHPDCSIHHPKKQPNKADARFKAEQEKRCREVALANAIGLRTLSAIVAAVPVRLMKRDLLFLIESLLPLLDEPRLTVIARNRGIRAKENESVARLLAAVLRKADESELGRALVEVAILLAVRSHRDGGKVVKTAALAYKVDTDDIAHVVKQEFVAKEKAKATQKVQPKPVAKLAKKAA